MIDGLRRFDAILLGALGDPRAPRGLMERDVLIGIRRRLDLFVNLRPIVLYDGRLCPLKDKTVREVRFFVMRENTEDVYAQAGVREGGGGHGRAGGGMRLPPPGVQRSVR